jgi:hypothetical protein
MLPPRLVSQCASSKARAFEVAFFDLWLKNAQVLHL